MLRKCLVAILALASAPVFASEPSTGTLTPTSGPVVYTIAPFTSSNPTPVPLVEVGPTCEDPAPQCDHFDLTVSLPAGYAAAHNSDFVRVTLAWNSISGESDYDLWIYKGTVASTNGGMTPDYQGDGGANPEVAQVFPLRDGDNAYTIKIVPYTAGGESLTVTVELMTTAGVDLDPSFGQPDAALPGVPRYQNFVPTGDVVGEASNAEINVGYNPATGRILLMGFLSGTVLRLNVPERLEPALPESCQALWEDASPAATTQAQPVGDPILFTDQQTGRTWASNLTAGPNASYAFTDDDGDSWIDAGGGGIAGADHQSIGAGPYPADFALPHPLYPNAVYFCSQAIVGPGGCVRSDDGGMTYGPTVLAYDGSTCSGLHGHLHVAPNGAVWLPVETCGTGTGYALSLDAGQTWEDKVIPASEGKATLGSDPAIALDADSTAYFCYADGDGLMKATVSTDNGANWSEPVNLGAAHKIVNAAFPQAWGGSAGRAACAFIGTNQPGNLQSIDFPGIWYGFVAHTYDGGQTWTTSNVTPNDPVQGQGGVWHGGGSNDNRNLLDFNEMTADERGRVLFAYDDGCVRDCAKDPQNNPQSFTAMMKLARQTGGRSLFAANDPTEPHAPSNACLSGTRSQFSANLSWAAPDHGGAAITNYKVFRSDSPTVPGTFVGDAGAKTAFVDTSADPNVEKYWYTVTAVNASGESLASNLIELPVVPVIEETSCAIPGITLYTDASDDSTSSGVPGHELLGAAMSEPKDLPGKLVLTMKVDSLSPTPPPSSRWATYYDAPDGSGGIRYVAMVTTDGLPTFEYGKKESIGGTVGSFVPTGTPDAASSWSTDGTIAIVLDKAALGIAEGSKLTGVWTVVRSTSAADGSGLTVDDTVKTVYQLRGTAICDLPAAPPVVGPVIRAVPADENRFGGALGLYLLLPLLALAGLRRRGRRLVP